MLICLNNRIIIGEGSTSHVIVSFHFSFLVNLLCFFLIVLLQLANCLDVDVIGTNNNASTSSAIPISVVSATQTDVERCLDQMVARVRRINGPFLSQQQGIQITKKSMEMYLAEKMSIEQIADYFFYNYDNLGLTPKQCQTLADVYATIVDILDNSNNTETTNTDADSTALPANGVNSGSQSSPTFGNAINAVLAQIRADKAEADEMIAQMEKEGRTLEAKELALCRFSSPRITPERKWQIVRAIGALIPVEKRAAIGEQMNKLVRLG